MTGPVAVPLTFDLGKLKLSLGFAVTHKPGADLSVHAYPLLVYAPGQHGPGIRTEDHGIPVADIVTRAAELPDYDQLAAHFGTSRDHVAQAIAYAVAATPESGYTSNPTVTITGGGSGATATAVSSTTPEPGA